MLKIFNDLKPFFEDVFREISVREYGKEMKISPPTASKQLKSLENEGLLISNARGIYIYFRASKEFVLFRQMARTYWYCTLFPLTDKLYEDILYKKIILFGSLAKAENTNKSDIDLYLDIAERKVDVSKLQKATKRAIQLHFINSLKNENLRKNIEAGVMIR